MNAFTPEIIAKLEASDLESGLPLGSSECIVKGLMACVPFNEEEIERYIEDWVK